MSISSPEKIFSLDDNRVCISKYFKYLHEQVLQASHNNHMKTLVFRVEEDFNWLVKIGEGTERISSRGIEKSNIDCIVLTDSYSMAKISRGILKPMSALMGGHIKLYGDTNVFGELSIHLRAAVKVMMEKNRMNFNLDVSIKKTFEKIDEGGNRHTVYVIRSIDRIGGIYWETSHRFSDFVTFRKQLESKGYPNLPQLPRRHLMSNSSVDPKVVRRRMEDLSLFVQLVIIQIGSMDEAVLQFLGAVPGSEGHSESAESEEQGRQVSGNGEFEGDDGENVRRHQALIRARHHAASTISNDSPTVEYFHPSSVTHSTESLHRECQWAAHVQNTGPIVSRSHSPSTALREEVFSLRRRLEKAEESSFWPRSSDGEKSVTAAAASVFLYLLPRVTLWGTIFVLVIGVSLPLLMSSTDTFISTLYAILNQSHLSEKPMLVLIWEVCVGLVVPLPLSVVGFGFLTLVCAMQYTRAPAAVALVGYLIFPIFTSLLSVLCASIVTQQIPTVFRSCSPPLVIVYDLAKAAVSTVVFRPGFGVIFCTWILSTALHHSISQVKIYGEQCCTWSAQARVLTWIMTVERMFTIYTPTATVVSAYLYLTIILRLCGCRKHVAADSSSALVYAESKNENRNMYTAAFDALDRVLAAYVLTEVRSLKSVFIKVAQYVAGRPDLVSALWSTTLGCLHDNCPQSSALHVRSTVEFCLSASSRREEQIFGYRHGNRIRTIEEMFESFDMNPQSSGSVAQVHNATMLVDGIVRDVVVKVQHPGVETLLMTDISAALFIAKVASRMDPKWEALLTVIKVWQRTIAEELDFRIEAKNLVEAQNAMQEAGFGTLIPSPIRGYVHRRVFVMTKLKGFKITDDFALSLHNVDKSSLLCRLAHSLAYHMLVAGCFNADPHPGNVFCVESSVDDCAPPVAYAPAATKKGGGIESKILPVEELPSMRNQLWHPGLLDFGITKRINDETRLAYCHLLISIQEEDIAGVDRALKSLGYANNQSDRAPERDREFFEFLFRDANDLKTSHTERKLFNDMRSAQRAEDRASGHKSSSIRSVRHIPEEYYFISRTVGLLRGLAALMKVHCPIMEIFTLHARVGIHQRNDDLEE